MRFLADEGISALTIAWLREHGHTVVSVREQGLFSVDDNLVLALALSHQAVLLTRDVSDFSKISYLANEPHHGIILLRPGKDETATHINALLALFLARYGEMDPSGQIIVITPKRIRFRPPLEQGN